MLQAFLGIDVAKHKVDVVLLKEQNKLKHKAITQTPEGFAELQSWLLKQGVVQVHACLEATGSYSEDLAIFLQEQGHRVSVVNPARISAFAKSQLARNKTDKIDAELIARFCQTQNPELFIAPSPAIRELQVLVRHLDNLTESLQREKNRLEAAVKSKAVVQSIQTLIQVLKEEIRKTRKKIEDLFKDHPDIRNDRDLLATIPGIGDLTASKLLAEIPNLKRYESVKQLVAFAGLNPRQYMSGSAVYKKAHISKTGSSRVRKMLFMPALVAKTKGEGFKAFEKQLLKNGKAKMVVVGAIMRKLLHIIYGVLKNNKPFDPLLAFAA
ncbi:IS110 family transposase [Deltaproteobacteria bacterium PRO3]|nr:IS110 family transposase [Deltaproteobacteria bacterium PRO3]